MRILQFIIAFAFVAAEAFEVKADSTIVSFDSGNFTIYDSDGVTPLTGGTSADGNGAVLQLGYYSAATTSNNFAGNWIALSGEGSANSGGSISGASPSESFNKTSIGDTTNNGAGNGTFALTLQFVSGDSGTGNNLPSTVTIPLSIRIYNKATIASSTFYNVVSDDLWTWQLPSTPSSTITISLNDANLEWLGGSSSAFKTTVAIPEPSSPQLIAFGSSLAFFSLLLRRKKAVA